MKGWFGERQRHSLAARGMSTNIRENMKEFQERMHYQRELKYKFIDLIRYLNEHVDDLTWNDRDAILGLIDSIENANDAGPYAPNVRDHSSMFNVYRIKTVLENWNGYDRIYEAIFLPFWNLKNNQFIHGLGENMTEVNPLWGGFY